MLSGRANQKERTRRALLQAASELIREGREPSVPEAAARALVSVATAYRYFSSAEDLFWEASEAALPEMSAEAATKVEAAGNDPQARLEAILRSVGFRMLDDEAPFRQAAKLALDQWFRQVDAPPGDRVPVRQGRRTEYIAEVVAPLAGQIPEENIDRIARALGIVVGTEAMISLVDAMGLDVPTAKASLLDAGRWLLAGALAELAV